MNAKRQPKKAATHAKAAEQHPHQRGADVVILPTAFATAVTGYADDRRSGQNLKLPILPAYF
jgi:hypothetical protein